MSCNNRKSSFSLRENSKEAVHDTENMQAEYKTQGLNKMQNHFPLPDHHSKCSPIMQQVKKSPPAASPQALQGHNVQNHIHHLSEGTLASLQTGGQPQQLHCSCKHPRSRATWTKCWSCQEHGCVLWWQDLSPVGIVWLLLLIAAAGIHSPGLWAKQCSLSEARWWGLGKRVSKCWGCEQDRPWAEK